MFQDHRTIMGQITNTLGVYYSASVCQAKNLELEL
jgi:hypothetical protein